MAERRQNPLLLLAIIILCVLICLLVAIPLSLDRLGDRLTAAISEEVHSEMWEQIRVNREQEEARRRLLQQQTFDRLEVQELQGEAWWRQVIKRHPELGDD